MRAVVRQGERSVSVEHVPDPTLSQPDSAIVTVERTAICGSDLHLYHGGPLAIPVVRLGHEFIGTVTRVGGGRGPCCYPMPVALMRRLTFRVTIASVPSTWDRLMPLVTAGRLYPEEVFTHRMPLTAAPEAYRIFDSHAAGVLKVLLDPTA